MYYIISGVNLFGTNILHLKIVLKLHSVYDEMNYTM